MTNIYWDTMLLIYMLEGSESWSRRVQDLLERSRNRGEQLLTSSLALGEILAGVKGPQSVTKGALIKELLVEGGFQFLPFDEGAADIFGALRSQRRIQIADAVHLACASSRGVDLFLTGDRALMKLHVPGIKFITDFNSTLL